jgi:hypothetical protein
MATELLSKVMQDRVDGQTHWLFESDPYCFDEQKHLNIGTPERIYWHYGYQCALVDMVDKVRALEQENDGLKVENADFSLANKELGECIKRLESDNAQLRAENTKLKQPVSKKKSPRDKCLEIDPRCVVTEGDHGEGWRYWVRDGSGKEIGCGPHPSRAWQLAYVALAARSQTEGGK